jgi:2-phosphosulfolactate phosphatase
MIKRKIEVCLTQENVQFFNIENCHIVVVDVLRATSAICAAFASGAKSIIPIPTVEEAEKAKNQGFIVAAERDGIKLPFADFGNSPFNFTPDKVAGKEIAYSTTNGTQAIIKASAGVSVAIGSFLNLSAVAQLLTEKPEGDILILCSGWKGKFCLEDTLFAGALAEILLKNESFYTKCDSTHAAIHLWGIAKLDISSYLDNIAQKYRLKKLGLDNVIEYCFKPDTTSIVPVLLNGKLVVGQ